MSLRNLIDEARLLVDEFVATTASVFDSDAAAPSRECRLKLSQLEERLLLSTAPMDLLAPEAMDVADGTAAKSLNVTVTAINENNPVFTSGDSPSVPENTTSVVTLTATDADIPSQSITFSISGGADASLFSIDPLTNELSFLASPDFKSPGDADTNNTYEVEITAVDGNGGATVQSISVVVTPVNDNNPVFTSADSHSVPENTTRVVTLTATDRDLPSQSINFSISGGADAARFTIAADTDELTFSVAPEFEAPGDLDGDNIFEVQITADDGNGGSTVHSISVRVTAVNDNNPMFTSNDAPSMSENTTDVVTLTATDADLPSQSVTFSISGGADAAFFEINSATDVLMFLASPNFEASADADGNNDYEVEITADDDMGGSTVQLINVTVTPVNESGPEFTSNDSVSVSENTTAVVTLTATDADLPLQLITFSISGGTDADLFTIDPVTDALSFNSAPDFEIPSDADGDNTYQVEVTADDGNGGSTVQSISVTVTAINDNITQGTADSIEVVEGDSRTLLANGFASLLDNESDADVPTGPLLAILDDGPSFGSSFALRP